MKDVSKIVMVLLLRTNVSFLFAVHHQRFLAIMKNVTSYTTFILINYEVMEQQTAIYVTVFLLSYSLILTLNTSLILVIVKEKSLHEPMYIFICNLSYNSIYGSTALLPHITSKLISQSYTISLAECATQVFCLHTTVLVELMILAIMGYDRYAAICTPLHYHNKMSPRNVALFVALSWLFPLGTWYFILLMTLQLSFCSNVIPKTHCTNFDLVRLSCSDTSVNNIVGVFSMFIYLAPQFLVILLSYVQILRVCMRASRECRKKALQTWTPHLLTVIISFFGVCFELVQVRMRLKEFSHGIAVFMSVYFLLMPPLLNPMIYGVGALKIHISRFVSDQKGNELKPTLWNRT